MHNSKMFDESVSIAWKARFGIDAPSELPDLDRFLNHRSVRRYTSQPIPEDTMAGIVAAGQSASTSSNLQLYSLISVQDPERRAQVAHLCADQKQVLNAAWFFAFVVDHFRLREAAIAAGESPEGLDYAEFFIMAIIDAALAAERMVCAAESLGIGACYIGALRNHPTEIHNFLDLPEGSFGAFGLCFGYPDADRVEEIKPRLSQSAIWHRETYRRDQSSEIADYDRRMSEHYQARGMNPDVAWSQRSGRRVDGSEKSLTGREALKAYIESQPFWRR